VEPAPLIGTHTLPERSIAGRLIAKVLGRLYVAFTPLKVQLVQTDPANPAVVELATPLKYGDSAVPALVMAFT